MQLGQVAQQQQQRELTALEAVGAQRQAQSQRGLDIARQQFQEEQTFPERTLQQYQSVLGRVANRPQYLECLYRGHTHREASLYLLLAFE